MVTGGSPWEHDEGAGHPPKVLFAIGGLGSGGSETQLTELLVRARHRDVEAHLVLMEEPGDNSRVRRLGRAGIEPMVIGGLTGARVHDGLRLLRGYLRAIDAVRPDVVYAWLEETSMFLVPLARLNRIPVVVARRNVSGSPIEQRLYLRRAVRWAEAGATLVTANSAAVLDEAVARGVARHRLRLVLNGHPEADALPVPGGGEIVFGYLARLRPEKGHARLIEAAARLPRDLAWRILLGGDGPLESEIRRLAEAVGVADRIEFLGEVEDAREFWRRAHVAVLLSDHEGSPNSLIEAAFAGRPIVATAVGGTAELVTTDIGFPVAPADVAGAARAMEALLRNAPLRSEMGSAAHLRVAARHGMDAFVDGHVAVLKEAAAHRPAGRTGRWRDRRN